jgi:hypothetical protein
LVGIDLPSQGRRDKSASLGRPGRRVNQHIYSYDTRLGSAGQEFSKDFRRAREDCPDHERAARIVSRFSHLKAVHGTLSAWSGVEAARERINLAGWLTSSLPQSRR